jgi:hypothetical protein
MAKASVFSDKLQASLRHSFVERLQMQMDNDSFEDLCAAVANPDIPLRAVQRAIEAMGLEAPWANMMRWRRKCLNSTTN